MLVCVGRGSSEFKPPGRIFNGNFQLWFLLSFSLEVLHSTYDYHSIFFLFSSAGACTGGSCCSSIKNIGQFNAHKKQGGCGEKFLVFIAMGGDSIMV